MMRWGRKKPVSSSWFSKLSGCSDLKPAKEKKQGDEKASQNMSAKPSLSSTKRGYDIHESSKTLQRVSVETENTATGSANMESNEKFGEIMKKVRDFQRETCGFLEGEKQRCERRDQRLLQQKPLRSKQDAEAKTNKPGRRTGTGSYSREDSVILGNTESKPAHQWQKLKDIKLREVKLKADQQRKSLYLRRELNRLGTKENNKVRAFSPRVSEKCRVKATEDLKKVKLRAREHERVMKAADEVVENESFAVVKCSSDPHKDFRDSMIEMIMENGINHPEELKELLVCYLRL